MRRWASVWMAALAFLPFIVHAQAIDREAVYQKALPLYQYDAGQPLGVKMVGVKTIGTTRMVRFSYVSTNGLVVPSLLFLPASASAAHPAPCLILLHGLGGSKEFMAGIALAAAAEGYASLAIDEYGQGERVIGNNGTVTLTQNLVTAVQQTAVDVRRGVDYLQTRPDINAKRVGLIGVSFGAIIGTVAAGVEPRLKAVALISGGGDWPVILKPLAERNAEVGGRQTSGFKTIDWSVAALVLAPVDPLTFAPHIAPRPLLMECGRKDNIIVPQAAQELFDAAKQPKQIDWYADYGHVPPPEVVLPAMQKFFAAHL